MGRMSGERHLDMSKPPPVPAAFSYGQLLPQPHHPMHHLPQPQPPGYSITNSPFAPRYPLNEFARFKKHMSSSYSGAQCIPIPPGTSPPYCEPKLHNLPLYPPTSSVNLSIPPPTPSFRDMYNLPPPLTMDVTKPPPIMHNTFNANMQILSATLRGKSLQSHYSSGSNSNRSDPSHGGESSSSRNDDAHNSKSDRRDHSYKRDADDKSYKREPDDKSYKRDSDDKSYKREADDKSYKRDTDDKPYKRDADDKSYKRDADDKSFHNYNDRLKYRSDTPSQKSYYDKYRKASSRSKSTHTSTYERKHSISREQSSYRDTKIYKSSQNSRSPPRKHNIEYYKQHVSKITKTCSESGLSHRNKVIEEEQFENNNREDVPNTIEKACENPEFSEEKSDDDEPLLKRWYRSSPAELYYVAVDGTRGVVESTSRGRKLSDTMREKLIERGKKMRPPPGTEPIAPPRTHRPKLCKHKSEHVSSSSSSSGSDNDEADHAMQELERKQQHPRRLHPEMWYNDPGEMNDGPLCRCSARTKRQGIRHGVYAAESSPMLCDIYTNNADKLYHYRITISPPTNFLIKTLTVITHDEHEFLFSGFSLLSHYPLTKLPTCKVIRFNIEYTILYIEEQAPINYTIEELDLFEEFLFREVLELVDLDMGKKTEDGCSQFHLLPRWERALGGGGGEVLAMVEVLRHLIRSGGLLLPSSSLPALRAASQREWQSFVDGVRGMIVTYPGKKPCSVRVDQLDRSLSDDDIKSHGEKSNNENENTDLIFPEIVHFGIRPPQLSYAGNPEYKKAWRDYVKFRHLVANMAKPSYEDKRKLESKEARLQEMRTQTKMKRDVTVALSAEGFYRTGIMCDVVQHAMLIPVLISHLRFHNSLNILEKIIGYKFENRSLLQLALTHPSYRDNFGTNPDHARNSLTNCGIRQPEYGDRRIHYMNIRKRGINTLINIMSRFGKKQETESAISHNERLEFLGDAVVEFISSIHLFKMFPSLEEGGLATYRAAIVQNQHLAQLAKKLGLEQYMLYAHGSDLCHDLELRHAMANCFEALMGALFLDGGIDVADRVFGLALWKDQSELLEAWRNPRLHPLQDQEPFGDRRWLDQYPFLQNLTKFEDSIGIQFKHIRLLARAFTDRSMGFTNLTLGSNQRLEFLGDTVLQLISSEHLYKHFPEHHEGHLSLLRSSLVNNRTQAVVCDDLAMSSYAVYHNPKAEPKTKDKADLLEAFLGALYIDKNIEYCHAFCSVCLFPRLREFIMNQEWNDPKSKLQQCCLTLRTMDGAEPDIPIYKVIECVGPTNTREYTVAVYFRGERLASARGHCIQEAEMNAAKQALTNSHNLFPQLDRQKRVIAKSMKRQRHNTRRGRYAKIEDYKDNGDHKSHYSRKNGERSDDSRHNRSSSDRSSKHDSKKKSKSGRKDKFSSSFIDRDKLPMAYRPDRFDNKDNDNESNSVNENCSVAEMSDVNSDTDNSIISHINKSSDIGSD